MPRKNSMKRSASRKIQCLATSAKTAERGTGESAPKITSLTNPTK